MYGEEDILGNHVYGRGEDYLVEKAKTGDNREFAVEYLRSSKKVAIDTFSKSQTKETQHTKKCGYQSRTPPTPPKDMPN